MGMETDHDIRGTPLSSFSGPWGSNAVCTLSAGWISAVL
jgi:hypothetical protein